MSPIRRLLPVSIVALALLAPAGLAEAKPHVTHSHTLLTAKSKKATKKHHKKTKHKKHHKKSKKTKTTSAIHHA